MTDFKKILSRTANDQAPQMQSILIAVLFVVCFLVLLYLIVVLVRFFAGLG